MSVADRRPLAAVVTARTALVVTVAFALALGSLAGSPRETTVAVGGALAFAWSVDSLQAASLRRLVVGTIALLAGPALVAVGTYVAANSVLVLVLSTAVAVVAVETVAGFTIDAANRLVEVAKRSGTVILAGGVALTVTLTLVVIDLHSVVGGALFEFVTMNSLVAFVWLQVGVLVGAVVATDVLRRLESLGVTASGDGQSSLLEPVPAAPLDVPSWYPLALVAQFLLASWRPAIRFVSSFLDTRPVVGPIVRTVLLSGVLQAILASVLLVLVLVFVVVRLGPGFVDWAGREPATSVADASGGGFVLFLATGLGLVLLRDLGATDGLGQRVDLLGSVLGPVVGVLGAALLILGVAATLFVGAGIVLDSLSPAARGYTAGSALLFGATLLAADALSAVVVVAGAAAALFVWHLGVHAFDLQRNLHGVAPTQRSEVVHAVAAGVALTAGAVAALATGYVGAPAFVAVPSDRAMTALVLVFVAVLAFGVVLRR